MKWWPVKSDTENPPYISMNNFDKIQWMEKFYVHPTEFTPNNKSWNFSSIGQILLKISFLNGKNNSFRQNEL